MLPNCRKMGFKTKLLQKRPGTSEIILLLEHIQRTNIKTILDKVPLWEFLDEVPLLDTFTSKRH